jgi:NAD(P)-dependent dehydrogenase (short-subunit alcohol dehydrogenase family)
MSKSAVITGAGTGVGRAVAIALVAQGWKVALIGRTLRSLNETRELCGAASACSIHVCDIGDLKAVQRMGEEVLKSFTTVDALINAAGTNTPKRSLEQLSIEDYRSLIDTNLNGAYYCTQAFLPGMRQRGAGSIVHVVSEAAKQASPKAGPAYVMSKFGLLGLTQSINAEEKTRGIRACAILPGDIDTPLLDKRPAPPGPEARQKMLQPDDVAQCVLFVLNLPERAVVEEILIRPK